jgi:hypothetical protein
MNWISKAPTAVVVAIIATCGVVTLGVLAAFVLLSVQGVDTTEFRQWVQTIGQLLVFPLLGIGTVASVSAARSASNAEEQTNGASQVREQDIAEAAVKTVLAQQEQQRRRGGMQ